MAEPPKSKAYLTAKNRFWQISDCARQKVQVVVMEMAAGGLDEFPKSRGEKYSALPIASRYLDRNCFFC